MAALLWVVIAIVVVAVIALVAVGVRKRRTAMLRDRFGPEYDRAVESRDDRRAAEADLRAREKQRAQFDVEPLPEADRLRPDSNGAAGNGAAGNGAACGTTGQAQSVGVSNRQGVTAGPESQDSGTSTTGQVDGPTALGSDGAGPAGPGPDYHDQRIGRPEGR